MDVETTNKRFRFGLTNWFWLILVVAIAMSWLIDHRHLVTQTELLNLRIARLQAAQDSGVEVAVSQ